MALEPIVHELGGAVHMLPPAAFTDVTLDGRSIIANEPIEVEVWPDGWGFVCVQKQINPDHTVGAGKVQIDGQKRNYTYWGRVVLTVP